MSNFKILSIDGGGSKGVYSLGVLKQVEALMGEPLCNKFQLIYGTSTGSIIAALLALGKTVDEIQKLYTQYIPYIMGRIPDIPFITKQIAMRRRSSRLNKVVNQIFGSLDFSAFKTDIGIVATHVDYAKPMIFKSSLKQAHGRENTFKPGFGVTIAQAVRASCAAFPYFKKVKIKTENQGTPELLDGGFVANNPTLFAISDAIKAYEIKEDDIRVLSVGVGTYSEPSRNFIHNLILNQWPYWLTRKTIDCNTNTVDIIRKILLKDVKCVRIDETFAQRDYETDLLETDINKLDKLFQLGRESYAKE
ncbi:MAG: patatin-like phospholipase family protein, partial [Endomicrobiales bacterium]